MTAAWHAQAVELYSSGMTLEQVGQEFGVTRERVRQVLEKLGVGTRGRDGGRGMTPKAVRLLGLVEQSGEHWLWNGALLHGAHPFFNPGLGASAWHAADASWSEFRGEIPFNRKARPACGESRCINPSHLRLEVGREASVVERFVANLRTCPSGCVEWTASRYANNYGHTSSAYPDPYAHRTAWIIFFGPIQTGMCVLHRCDNPPCCNPEHLFLGTARDNAEDRDAKGRGIAGRTIKRLTEEKREQILRMRCGGESVCGIARAVGVSSETVARALRNSATPSPTVV